MNFGYFHSNSPLSFSFHSCWSLLKPPPISYLLLVYGLLSVITVPCPGLGGRLFTESYQWPHHWWTALSQQPLTTNSPLVGSGLLVLLPLTWSYRFGVLQVTTAAMRSQVSQPRHFQSTPLCCRFPHLLTLAFLPPILPHCSLSLGVLITPIHLGLSTPILLTLGTLVSYGFLHKPLSTAVRGFFDEAWTQCWYVGINLSL